MMGMKESQILRSIMLALGNEEGFRLWRNNTGVLSDVTGRAVKFGLAPGSADIIGILAPYGRMICLEVKSETGRVREEQEGWGRIIREMGGVYAVVRSVEEAKTILDQARREI
jgi:hypothetical protein